jgi:hypothetical protein
VSNFHYYRPGYYHSFRRPYYAFRPRFNVGFGLWVGFPVSFSFHSYPYIYAYPYPYPYSYPYRYPYTYRPQYPIGTPGYPYPTSSSPSYSAAAPTAIGGLSFDIRPSDADLFVDGNYVGKVDQFSPNQPPLGLAPGRHYIEIHAPGYEPLAFEVDVLTGQVIPYQGELRRF